MSFDGWVKVIGLVASIWTAYYVGGWFLRCLSIGFSLLIRPMEVRLLGYLQDRATARTLGVDIDVLRARRKIDGYG